MPFTCKCRFPNSVGYAKIWWVRLPEASQEKLAGIDDSVPSEEFMPRSSSSWKPHFELFV